MQFTYANVIEINCLDHLYVNKSPQSRIIPDYESLARESPIISVCVYACAAAYFPV